MDNLIALVPSIGIGILFVLVIRYFMRADRIEREAMAELDAAVDRGSPREGAPINTGNAGSGTLPARPDTAADAGTQGTPLSGGNAP